jgi:hypothetical protein
MLPECNVGHIAEHDTEGQFRRIIWRGIDFSVKVSFSDDADVRIYGFI